MKSKFNNKFGYTHIYIYIYACSIIINYFIYTARIYRSYIILLFTLSYTSPS